MPALRGQVGRQPFHQVLAVACAPFTLLFGFHDAATDLPIVRRHQRIDAARRHAARSIEHFHDAAVKAGIVGRQGGGSFSRPPKASSRSCGHLFLLRLFARADDRLAPGCHQLGSLAHRIILGVDIAHELPNGLVRAQRHANLDRSRGKLAVEVEPIDAASGKQVALLLLSDEADMRDIRSSFTRDAHAKALARRFSLDAIEFIAPIIRLR